MRKWFATIFLDGIVRPGPQIGCLPGQVRVFMRCVDCSAVFPHWIANMTAAEVKARGRLGCDHCGGLRLTPTLLPSWRAFYWYVIRGWLVRYALPLAIGKVYAKVQPKRVWDPRIVAMETDIR